MIFAVPYCKQMEPRCRCESFSMKSGGREVTTGILKLRRREQIREQNVASDAYNDPYHLTYLHCELQFLGELRRSTVFTWMCSNRELVYHVTLWNSIKVNIAVNDSMTHANVHFQFFGELFQC
jgi:hypothetical protein